MPPRFCAGLVLVAVAFTGCKYSDVPPGSLVVTQTPTAIAAAAPNTILDVRYPLGSRVVLVTPPLRADSVRELSTGLAAAGDPCISWDGRRVFFAGKETADSDWQIYQVAASGGRPEIVTQMPGGAMGPALAAHDELVFASPVPTLDARRSARSPSALYAQLPGQPPRRLTFGPDSATDATVLRDGRILFVTAQTRDERRNSPHLCLFTINNDGTEVTAYAGQDGGADFVRRPREIGGSRIAFLAARTAAAAPMGWAESVRTAAPFVTRDKLFAFPVVGCRSVEATPEDDVLACIETHGWIGRSMTGSVAVFRIAANATSAGAPLFADPQWNCVEATFVATRPPPAGHTSAIMAAVPHGTVLCLNANNSSVPATILAPAAALRVFALGADGSPHTLGQAPVASDGSVMIDVPADVPLGFDTLDAKGHVLRHQPAFVWLRPGENHACVGCHERRNHTPRNIRPLATAADAAQLTFTDPASAPRTTAP